MGIVPAGTPVIVNPETQHERWIIRGTGYPWPEHLKHLEDIKF